MQVKTALVPLDGSILAEAALNWAADLTREGGKMILMRAAEASGLPVGDPSEGQVAAIRRAEEYLAGVLPRVRKLGVANVDTSVWYGPPAEAIVDAARFRNPDVIVMSTHGRSGLNRLILGSVAESVLRSTTTPILLVRSPQAPVDAVRTNEARAAAVPARDDNR